MGHSLVPLLLNPRRRHGISTAMLTRILDRFGRHGTRSTLVYIDRMLGGSTNRILAIICMWVISIPLLLIHSRRRRRGITCRGRDCRHGITMSGLPVRHAICVLRSRRRKIAASISILEPVRRGLVVTRRIIHQWLLASPGRQRRRLMTVSMISGLRSRCARVTTIRLCSRQRRTIYRCRRILPIRRAILLSMRLILGWACSRRRREVHLLGRGRRLD